MTDRRFLDVPHRLSIFHPGTWLDRDQLDGDRLCHA